MPKQGLLILSVMLIVFSLTLAAGGGSYTFFMSPSLVSDKYIQAGVFWLGTVVTLFGLAGFLAGLVGVMSVVLIRTAELKEQEALQQAMLEENTEEERR